VRNFFAKSFTEQITVVINDTKTVESTISGKLGASKVVSAELTSSNRDADGKMASVTMTYQVITGGLIITQVK
jgi:hypothetical protein